MTGTATTRAKRRLMSGALLGAALLSLALLVMGVVGTPPVSPTLEAGSQTMDQPPVSTPASPPQIQLSVAGTTVPDQCAEQSATEFEPASVHIEGLLTAQVESLPRVTNDEGLIASPAPTDLNPAVFAWDNESSLAVGSSNVLLTAHTHQVDHLALGNRLIDELRVDELIVLTGSEDETACYRVTQELEASVADYPIERVYQEAAGAQLVVTVCSGWDGSQWADRTLWFAEPLT